MHSEARDLRTNYFNSKRKAKEAIEEREELKKLLEKKIEDNTELNQQIIEINTRTKS